MNLEKEIISSIKGDFIWNGVKTEMLIPLSILDLICIHERKNYEIVNCIFNLIIDGYIFNANEKYHIKLGCK